MDTQPERIAERFPVPPREYRPTPAEILFTTLTEAAEALSKFLLQFPEHVRPDFLMSIKDESTNPHALPLLHVLYAIEQLDSLGEHTLACQEASTALHSLVYIAKQADEAIAPYFVNVPPSGKESNGAQTLDETGTVPE